MKSQIKRNVRWGIIGTNHTASQFAEYLLIIEGAELYATTSKPQQKLNFLAGKYKTTKSYHDYDSLINDDNLDAIYIATPQSQNSIETLLYLTQWMVLIKKKPFVANNSEVNRMLLVATENNVLIMKQFWSDFIPNNHLALSNQTNSSND